MPRRNFLCILSVFILAAAAIFEGGGALQGPREAATAAAADNNPFPRVAATTFLGDGKNWEEASKYQVLSGQAGGASRAQKLHEYASNHGRDITILRYLSPRAYQGEGLGIPLREIYPGHWLLEAGTTTKGSIDSSTKTIPVADTSVFQGRVGYYAMIFDAKGKNSGLTPDDTGFWANAEDVKIVSVGSGSITVQRGYDASTGTFKSSLSTSHTANSRIAVHATGSFTGPSTWAYNQSTTSPKNESGQRLSVAMATWVAKHLNDSFDNGAYKTFPGAWDGVLFDSTVYWLNDQTPKADVNNDLVADGGILTNGRSAWGEGVTELFSQIRNRLPSGMILTGGSDGTRGASHLNGTQFEAFPGASHSSDNYDAYSGALQAYDLWLDRAGTTPPHTEILARIGTDKFRSCSQFGQTVEQGSNRDFRFLFGSTLLNDGYFSYNNGCFGDYWWDEFSVNLSTGKAVPASAGPDAVAEHVGYLGMPKGPAQRLADPTSGSNLLTGGRWDLETSGGASGNLSTASGVITVNINNAGTDMKDLKANYGNLTLSSGTQYTLHFRAKASTPQMSEDLFRGMEIVVASPQGNVSLADVTLSGDWQTFDLSFQAPMNTTKATLQFRTGLVGGSVTMDSVGLYKGNADLFRRDFDNGTVVVNGTWSSQTVPLGGTFKKIDGTQDPINNGASVNSITLAPHDAIVLLRTSSSGSAPTPTTAPSATPVGTSGPSACEAPTISKASDTSPRGGGVVSFSWNRVQGATSYQISRQEGGKWVVQGTTSSTSYSHGDPWVDPQWRVRVVAGTRGTLPGVAKDFDPGG
jgi:hypothetical protein